MGSIRNMCYGCKNECLATEAQGAKNKVFVKIRNTFLQLIRVCYACYPG
jgi:hypothetical protein